jgi:pterin-4a-carbinolamine dehydratase
MGCFKAAIDAYTDVALLKEEVRHVPDILYYQVARDDI